ncbi:MAG: metallophosphoesterase [Crenarchaeota archaeon]|nr:MAG: metallophosphoesterase [Thermoproteota archaeon]RDJ33416.1 MAG: metallophosphoesterase [Thermoproteota archaeon]RDJ38017.1 MAG: metallophosphoesterase [Thermoproteota archaeon]RDJ38319.1 MAG: metallophosphoesterase [Thermoproteota archaeon]
MVTTRIVPQKPALILEGEKKNLIVSDLHIGFESNFSANKISLGKNTSTKETISEISELIKSEKPDTVILLGDVKSSIKNISKNEWDDVPMFFNEIKEMVEVILVPGNHDANIQRLVPEGVTMISSTGLVIDNVLLTHGHTMPSENFAHVDKIIMGHVHPVFFSEESVLNGQRVWVSLKAEKQNIFPSSNGEIEITIIPSFNRYFYATHRNKFKKSISPIIQKIKEVSAARIVTLDGTIIGDESNIKEVI